MFRFFTGFFFFLTNLSLCFSQNTDVRLVMSYLDNKEFDKAVLYLPKLYDKDPLFWFEHYYRCLVALKDWEKIEKICRQQSKSDKPHTYPLAYLGNSYKIQGKLQKARGIFDKALQLCPTQDACIRKLAETFVQFEEHDYALQTYQYGADKNPNYPYFYEKAEIHKKKGDVRAMVNEYLDAVEFRETELYHVQVQLNNSLGYDEHYGGFKNPVLKEELLKRIQKKNQSVVLIDFLIYVLNQQHEFYAAFIQSKALDKRLNEKGLRVYQQARICMDNEDFSAARACLEYLTSLKDSPFTESAEFLLSDLMYKELQTMINPPADKIQSVIQFHEQLSGKYPANSEWPDVIIRQALLYSGYSHQHEKAIHLLESLLNPPRLPSAVRGKVKLTLADILLKSGKIWDAALLYGQIDKEFKNDAPGFEAKFKNAKIHFYTGEFRLAKFQLDVLKGSTSKLIANDALELSLIISDGIGLDTNTGPLQYYARACLYQESGKIQQALPTLDSIDQVFSAHSLHDHVMYKKIQLFLENQQTDKAFSLLESFTDIFPESIHADDALLLRARLYNEYKKDKEQALKILEKFLEKYPGSVLIHTARNLYRTLRGDSVKQT